MRALLIILALLAGNLHAELLSSRDFFTNSTATYYQINQDGRFIIGRVLDKDGGYLEMFDTTTKKRHSLIWFSFEEKTMIRNFQWLSNDTIYLQARNKNENIEFFIDIKREAGDQFSYEVSKIESKGVILGDQFDAQGKIWFLFEDEAKADDEYISLRKVTKEQIVNNELSTGDRFQYAPEHAIYYDLDREGNPYYVTTFDKEEKTFYLKMFDSESREWVTVKDYSDDETNFTIIGRLANNNLAVLSNELHDKVVLLEYNPKTREYGDVIYQHNRYDLISAAIKADGTVRSVSYFDHGMIRNEYLQKKDILTRSVVARHFRNKQVVLNSSKNEQHLVAFVHDSDDPGAYYYVDRSNNSKYLINTKYKSLENKRLSKTIAGTAKASDGAEIEYLFTKGNNYNNKNVLLIMPHGGPVGVRDYALYDKEVQFYANRGYSILRVNFRGSAGFGKKFLDRGRGEFGRLIEQDITAALSEVEKKYRFDSRCSIGASYGGYSAIMLAIYKPKAIDCAIARFGVYDLGLLFADRNYSQSKEFQEAVEYVVGENTDELLQFSPIYMVDKITAKVLITGGYEDEQATIEHSNRLKYMMKKANKPFEQLFYRNTGHGHDKWYWDAHEAVVIDHFLRKSLGLTRIKDNEILREEYMMVADSYSFKDNVDDDVEKALHNYRLAVDLDEPRAAFNLGAHYHRGDGVAKDMEQAIKLYKRAAELKYDSAYYRLYELLAKEGEPYTDTVKAREYFDKAVMAGNKKAFEKAVELYCKSDFTLLELKQCARFIKAQSFEDDEIESLVVKTVSNILTKVDNKTRIGFYQELSDDSRFVTPNSINFEWLYHIVRNTGTIFEYEQDKLPKLMARLQNFYEVKFKLIVDGLDKGTYMPIKVSWNITEDTGERTLFSSYKLYDNNNAYYLTYRLVNDSELLPGNYTLVLSTMDGQVFARQKFEMVDD